MATFNNGNPNLAQNQTPKPKTINELAAMHTVFQVGDLEDQDCPICNDTFVSGPNAEFALKLPGCGHIFGLQCIKTWLESNNSCPMCRQLVLDVPPPANEGSPEFIGLNFVVISARLEELFTPDQGALVALFETTDLYMNTELQLLNIAAGMGLTFGPLSHIMWAQLYQDIAPLPYADADVVHQNGVHLMSPGRGMVVQIANVDNVQWGFTYPEEEPEDGNMDHNEEKSSNNREAPTNGNDNLDAALEAVRILHEMTTFFSDHHHGYLVSVLATLPIDGADRTVQNFTNLFAEREVHFLAAMANARPLPPWDRYTRASALSALHDLVNTHIYNRANGLRDAILPHPFGYNQDDPALYEAL